MAFKYSTAQCKLDIMVHYKGEFVIACMHNWLLLSLWATNRNVVYILSVLEQSLLTIKILILCSKLC